MDDSTPEFTEVEWLDGDDPAPLSHGTRRAPRRRVGYLLAVATVVAVVIAVIVQHDGGPSPHSQAVRSSATSHPVSVAPSSPTSSTPQRPSVSPSVLPPVVVAKFGHPLLDVPATWQLFALAANSVVRVDLAAGSVTTTRMTPLDSSGSVSLIVGPDRALVRPLDPVPGWVVLDDQPAQAAPAALNHGPVVPGPDPAHVWVQVGDGENSVMDLVSLDGAGTGTTVPVPGGGASVASDYSGGLLFTSTGGVYDARPSGSKRVTTGTLLAAGPTKWLVVECDDADRCQTILIDRSRGTRKTMGDANYTTVAGQVSPDGTTAALVGYGSTGVPTLELLNLGTGTDRSVPIALNGNSDLAHGIAWSPDSRYLFAAGQAGTIYVVDGKSAAVHSLPITPLPQLSEVVLRAPGAVLG